jgi:hypothetical protein
VSLKFEGAEYLRKSSTKRIPAAGLASEERSHDQPFEPIDLTAGSHDRRSVKRVSRGRAALLLGRAGSERLQNCQLLRDLEDNMDIDQSLLAAAMKLAQRPRHGQNQSHRVATSGDQ